jgi:hypothetical protein
VLDSLAGDLDRCDAAVRTNNLSKDRSVISSARADMNHGCSATGVQVVEKFRPQARLSVINAARLVEPNQSVVIDVIRVAICSLQYSPKRIGLMIRQGPGPTNASRGTVAQSSKTARDMMWAAKRNSSAYNCRAVVTEISTHHLARAFRYNRFRGTLRNDS